MGNARKGFARERHPGLKLALTATAVAGFALAWLGFESSHASSGAPALELAAPIQSPTAPATATPTPVTTRSSATPAPRTTAEPAPEPTASSSPLPARRRTRAS